MLRIGLSSCFFHPDPTRALFKGKTLLYLEESLAHWIMSEGALAYLLPSFPPSGVTVSQLVRSVDGIVLQGGADVSPASYGESPLRPEWAGDEVRDRYELALAREALQQRKPLLGICRGAQLLNVALGGTLYQDVATQLPGSLTHRHWEIYDQNFHEITITPGSGLSRLYPGVCRAKVNSVHHQSVKALGENLTVEATCPEDGVIEAIRYTGPSYAVGLQWHPEFQTPGQTELLGSKGVLKEFLQACH